MKWLFILLLIANVAILIWGIQREPVDQATEITKQRGVGNMRLLSEIEAEKDEVASPPADSALVTEQLATEEPSDGAQQAEGERSAAMPTRPKPEVKLINRCGVLGVIDDRQVAQEASKQLTDEGAKSSIQETQGKIEIGFWVVIPPMESSEAAQDMIVQLADAGITDVWHFRSGELNNAVSLGMFFQQENAEKMRQEIALKGFNAELRSRFLNKRRYSVHFKIRDEAEAVKRVWNRLKRRYPDIDLAQRPCGEIATE
jgi:cell division protein FtsN